ncbi:HAMP domain-containing protein [Novosphingobium colocasiae]
MRLSDRSVLRFHTYAHAAWKLTAGRVLSFVLPSLALVLLGWALLRTVLRPLRNLIRATHDLEAGAPRPVPEHGPDEMRGLIRALNDMQDRIHQSLTDRTQTMLAIGHDLKTPLARMRLRLDDESVEPEVREGIAHDIDEMRLLLDLAAGLCRQRRQGDRARTDRHRGDGRNAGGRRRRSRGRCPLCRGCQPGSGGAAGVDPAGAVQPDRERAALWRQCPRPCPQGWRRGGDRGGG